MEKMIERFNQIALPHRTFEKQQAIMDVLVAHKPEFIEGQGIIVKGKSGNNSVTKVIVSHFDLVHPFEKGFPEETIFTREHEGHEVISGALDNTLTNAMLINEVLENGLPDDTWLFFTDGEESGMWGMGDFMRTIRDDLDKYFFINLDVTSDNWDNMTSVEYDFPNRGISVQIDDAITAGFTTMRFADDMSPIRHAGGDGFSYCIPTKACCHSYGTNTTVPHFEAYKEGLTFMVQELDVQDKERDGSKYNMNGRII